LELAFAAGASGFLAGRAIWLDAFNHYPDWDVIERDLRDGACAYMEEISVLADQKAAAWNLHPCYGEGGARFQPEDASFRHKYEGFGS
jgi:tagatose 1,6-diphosphate aldolase